MLTVNCLLSDSTPEQPVCVTLSVNVVGVFTVNARVPPEGLTATVAPVELLVMVAVSALVLAHERFTELPGITQ